MTVNDHLALRSYGSIKDVQFRIDSVTTFEQ